MGSFRLVNQPTYNGASVYSAIINQRGIDLELQSMAADYSNSKLSLAENLRDRQSQPDLADDNYHAYNSGNLAFQSHFHSQVLILDNRTQKCLQRGLHNSGVDCTDSKTWDESRICAD